jgi:hypothetical protein
MPVEYRKYDATTATETTIEPATPQSNTDKGGDSLDLDYDSDLSFSSIGLAVLALEKRKTRSQTAKQNTPAKKKTPQKIQHRHPIRSRARAGKKKQIE